MEFTRQITFVLFVLGLLAGAVALLRRPLQLPRWTALRRRPRRVEVLERASLSPQASLALVRVDGREILIAIAGASCSVIEEKQRAAGVAA
jgi:flagellar biogenesis protein FliO